MNQLALVWVAVFLSFYNIVLTGIALFLWFDNRALARHLRTIPEPTELEEKTP